MSTIKSSTEHLTLNADGSGKDIKFQANGVEVASISSTGNLTSTGIDDNATSTAITIDASENVGIGVSPSHRVHAESSAADSYIYYGETSDASNGFGVYEESDTSCSIFARDATGSLTTALRNNGGVSFLNGGGNVGIGTASPTAKIHAEQSAAGIYAAYFHNTNADGPVLLLEHPNTASQVIASFVNGNGGVGTISTSGTSTAYNTSSDYRLKENVVPMTGSIDRLKDLKPSRFNFKADADTTVDGFLAHEAGEVVPECATGTKDAMKDEEYEVTPAVMDGETVVTEAVMGTRSVPDYQGIDQSKLSPLTISALQEAITLIEQLTARVTELENA